MAVPLALNWVLFLIPYLAFGSGVCVCLCVCVGQRSLLPQSKGVDDDVPFLPVSLA